jgi:hypothetical protein
MLLLLGWFCMHVLTVVDSKVTRLLATLVQHSHHRSLQSQVLCCD